MDISEITESLLYREFMTELEICKKNSMFLALYGDINIIKLIFTHLKKSLPDSFALTFPVSSNPDFAPFFKKISARKGEKSNIIHVVGIENLPEHLISNITDYLQYTREHFKSVPYSLVFWIPPQFEKQLFFCAPDFHNRVSGTYDFTEKKIENKQAEKTPEPVKKTNKEALLKIINNTYYSEKLSTQSLLMEMAEYLPVHENEEEINIASLYRAYTGKWICGNEWNPELSHEEKRDYLWQLSLDIFKSSNDFSDSLSGPDPAFLSRDSQGNYQFVHKSFMEYFLAEYYVWLIKNKKERIVSYTDFNEETKYFLKLIISSEKHNLQNLNLSNLNLEKINLSNADFTGSDLQRTNLSGADLTGAILNGTDLTRANLQKTVLNKAVLTQARLILTDITKADLRESDMTEANLQRANLVYADLTNASLRKASINDADLTNANLRGTYLNETDFRWANLERTNLNKAEMTGINLLKANLKEADMTEADLRRANLSDADLTGANLIRTDLRQANINKTNLSVSNLNEADLSEANLWKANLQKADLTGANLQKASLVKADLRWASLNKANLKGADLWQANLNEADLTGAVYNLEELQKAYLEGAKI
ncbi:MAG: pentapeptide repeat-containing protein [Desulfobacterales bacterium]|nr:pentapeptide repeat-containing protein [Desulfobacterales bacterium]